MLYVPIRAITKITRMTIIMGRWLRCVAWSRTVKRVYGYLSSISLVVDVWILRGVVIPTHRGQQQVSMPPWT